MTDPTHLQVAEFTVGRARDVSWSAQRTRLMGSLAGLPSRQRSNFGKAVESVVSHVVAGHNSGTVQFGLVVDGDRQAVEVVVREQFSSAAKQLAGPSFQQAEELVDNLAVDQTTHGWACRLTVRLPAEVEHIPAEVASEWATPLAMRSAQSALSGSQRRISELAENLQKSQQRGVDLEQELNNLRALNETLELLAMVASKTDNAVIILDDQSRIEWVNDSFVRMTGYEMGDVQKKPVIEVLHGQDSDTAAADELQAAFSAGHGVSQEILHHRKDGRTYWASISITPVFNDEGSITRWIGIAADATRRRHAQEALNHAKTEAELASRTKSEFLANMSHEIRTPMNAVIGMAELALETQLDDEQREYLTTILDSAESLLGLLNDILDLSKIEAGKLRLEQIEFPLAETLRDTLKPFAYQAKQQGIGLKLDLPLDVPERLIGDPARLRQIVTNLVGNAVKFTNEGEIAVSVEVVRRTAWQAVLRFEVRDSGIGIPTERLEQIFEAFTQVDSSTSRRFGGTGLGLTISTQLVELMGGRIWVESKEQHGSTFHFEVEFQIPDATTDAQRIDASSNVSSPSLRKLRILVADDNRANRSLARKILEKEEHSVVEAGSGKQVLELLPPGHFDIVLLDIQMPEMDGLETVGAIRQMEGELPSRPYVIALTAHAMQGDRERCLAAGMDAYIAKPIRARQLLAMIEAVACSSTESPMVEPLNDSDRQWDFSMALNRLEGDRELLAEQMRFYLEDSPILVRDLSDAIAGGDSQKLQMSAHRLRGLSAGFDATQLVAASGQLEEAAATGSDDLARTSQNLIREHERLCEAIERFLKSG